MIVMSCINVICALCVDTDPPPANGLSAIDEEEEPPEERWEFENPSKVTKTSPEMV